MKEEKIWIAVLVRVALFCALIMVVLGLYPSWSQYARSLEESLLFITLWSISVTYVIRSFTYSKKEQELFKIRKMPVRIKHMNRVTAVAFGCILFTPVTHPEWWIQSLHMVSTGVGILSAYTEIAFFYKTRVGRFVSTFGLLFGSAGFLNAFLFHSYSIAIGELLASVPIASHVLIQNKKK